MANATLSLNELQQVATLANLDLFIVEVNGELKAITKNDAILQGPTGPAGADGANGADGIFSAIATQSDAEGGTDNVKGMTPLRVKQAIDIFGPGAGGVVNVSDLGDVDITGLVDKSILRYDNASTSWKVVQDTETLEALDDVTITAASDRNAILYDGAAGEWKNFETTPWNGQLFMEIKNAENDVYFFTIDAPWDFTIDSLTAVASAGSVTGNVQIGGTSVTGLSAVAINTTKAETNGTAANTVSGGNEVKITLTGAASLEHVRLALNITRV